MSTKTDKNTKPAAKQSIGFMAIQDSIVTIRHKTIEKQTKAYARAGNLYAKAAGGYIKLRADGGTTHQDITWLDIEGCGDIQTAHSARFLEYTP